MAIPLVPTTQDPPTRVGSCVACGQVYATRTPPGRPQRCSCGGRIHLAAVTGHKSHGRACGDECLYARTRRCTCSCGGGNHGAGYLDGDNVPDWVRTQDAERHAQTRSARADRASTTADRKVAATVATLTRWPELGDLLGARYADSTDERLRCVRRGLLYHHPIRDVDAAAVAAVVRRDRESRT